jgi:glycosyltransferase involved in cell wall biosynthesis
MKKIGIDARFYGSIGKGLGRYTQKLIENLEKIDHKNSYVVFLRKENFDEYTPNNINFKKELADYRWYSFAEQLLFPLLLFKKNLDLVHFPHFNVPLLYRRKFVMTVHDLILLHFPTLRGTTLSPFFYWLKYAAYKITIGSAIRRASLIIAVSEFTKKDIALNYPSSKNKLVVTYEACDFSYQEGVVNDEKITKKYGIIKPYLLYVGNAYPHKNLEKLIVAFILIKRAFSNMQLVLVGKEDYFYNRLKDFVKNKRIEDIVFTGYVPDNELGFLYRNAQLYIFPSLYEGFGLPPLEAMSQSLPVVSSSHDCMREILGEAAYYVDCTKEEEIVKAVGILLQDEKMRKDFIEKGLKRADKFDWKEMAEKTLEYYEKIK